jgi:hypothetical protein
MIEKVGLGLRMCNLNSDPAASVHMTGRLDLSRIQEKGWRMKHRLATARDYPRAVINIQTLPFRDAAHTAAEFVSESLSRQA